MKAESRVPLAWIFAINHNRRDRLTDAILVIQRTHARSIPKINRTGPMIKALLLGVEGGWSWVGGRVL